MVCLPGITTAALFTSVIFYDLYDRNWSRIPGHGLFGIFATLLIVFICERTSEWLAWSLLTIPIVFCFIGSFFAYDLPKVESTFSCNQCNFDPCRCDHHKRKHIDPPVCPSPFPKPKPDNKPDDKPKKPDDNCIKTTLA